MTEKTEKWKKYQRKNWRNTGNTIMNIIGNVFSDIENFKVSSKKLEH
jgi:hypothetical protein